MSVLAAVVCAVIAAAAVPKGVVSGWDFRPCKNVTVTEKNKTVTVRFNKPGKIMPNMFRSIPCTAGAKIKLKLKVMGEGKLDMGCHVYDKQNAWITAVRGKAVELVPGKMMSVEFNVTIPVSSKGEVKAFRPFIDFGGASELKFSGFEYTIQEPAPSQKDQTTGGKFPPFFERFYPGSSDFPVRVLPSLKLIALDFIEKPFVADAMDIKSLLVRFVENKTNKVAAEKCFVFQNGVIQDAVLPLPDDLSGEYRITGEFRDKDGKVISKGRGYSFVMLMDMNSGWYVIAGTKYNAHLKNIVRPYMVGQKVFYFGKYPFQDFEVKLSDVPLPGFQHPRAKDGKISVLGRTYHFNKNGLPSQIDVMQNEPTVGNKWEKLLASPITLQLDGKKITGKVNDTLQCSSTAAEVRNTLSNIFDITSTIEQDGVIKLHLALKKGVKIAAENLRIQIPLRASQATLYHDMTDLTYRRINRKIKEVVQAGFGGHAGFLPEKKISGDVVWQSIDCDRRHPGSFNAMIWLGNEDRGFCCFGDSDKDFLVDNDRSCFTIERKGKTVLLNINLVNRKKSLIPENSTWTIGLLATPVKQMTSTARGTIFPRWATLDKKFYKKLTNLRKLQMVGAGDPRFTSGNCSILPQNAERTRQMYEAVKDDKNSGFFEYYCSDYLTWAMPEFAMYFGEWAGRITGIKGRAPSNWFKPYKGFDFAHATWIACRRIVPSYLQYRLWCIDQKIKSNGNLAFYEDNIHLRDFFDPAMKYGYRAADGSPRVQFDIWSLRDYYRKIAEIYRINGIENHAGAHASAAMVIPALTYCTYFIDGEQPGRYATSPKRDYVDAWGDVDYLRAHVLGRQFGIRSMFLAEITYRGKNAAEDRQQTRAWMAVMLPHDIALWDGRLKDRGPVKVWHKIINDLDFFKNNPRLYPYWATGKYKVAEHNDKELLVTLYRQNNRALAVISNFGKSHTVKFKLNSKNLSLKLKKAVDMENSAAKDITFDGSNVTLNIPRHDYRVVLFE